jgi:hypothetical protein
MRWVARCIGVVAVGAGVGMAAWGISCGALAESVRAPAFLANVLSQPGELIGWGAGLFAAGVTVLILTYMEHESAGIWDD